MKDNQLSATYYLEENGFDGRIEHPLENILDRPEWLVRINKTYCGEMEVPPDIAAQMLGRDIKTTEQKLYFLSVRVNYNPSSSQTLS